MKRAYFPIVILIVIQFPQQESMFLTAFLV